MTPFIQTGIILRKAPYGEADEIVTALLAGGGVRRFFAAGVRKSRRRYGGLVDHFSHLNLHYLPRPEGLWRLVSVEEIGASSTPWLDARAFALGHMLAELICTFTPEEVPSADIFALWRRVESILQARPVDATLSTWILLRFLTLFGYAIDLSRCRECGAGSEGRETYFAREQGGLLCGICIHRRGRHGAVFLSGRSRTVLLAEEIPDIHEPDCMTILLSEFIGFCEWHAQRPVRAAAFLMGSMMGTSLS